jgi:hypothetical protein
MCLTRERVCDKKSEALTYDCDLLVPNLHFEFYFLFFGSDGDRTQGLMHARAELHPQPSLIYK